VKQNGGNEEDGQDLFQEMIISVYKKVKKGDFELSCTFWSYALIVCRNLWFAKQRNKGRMTYTDNINGEKVIIEENMQSLIEQKESLDLYRKHFANLDSKCQQILSMFFDKIKMAEIANKLDTTPAYIKKRKFKCKEALIDAIKADHLYNELI
jgi:RNA polymerase sigma factor (sigma-70 family)